MNETLHVDCIATRCIAFRVRTKAFLICIVAFLTGAPAARADPGTIVPWLLYRDANPFVSASGLPFAPPALISAGWHVDALLSASNTEIAFDRDNEHLLYDMEIHDTQLALTRTLGAQWLVRATIGSAGYSSGFLDSLIETYHHTFGFSNGDRGRLGSDGHTIAYADAIGDSLVFDRQLHATTPLLIDVMRHAPIGASEWLAGATVKLPTSHASPLVDDRAADFSVWLGAQSNDPQTRGPWGARIGVMRRGHNDLLAQRTRAYVTFADATIGGVLRPGWDIAAQLQWHDALYDTSIPFLGAAATMSMSTAWHSSAGWVLRGGLTEDVTTGRAQDVTFFLSWSR